MPVSRIISIKIFRCLRHMIIHFSSQLTCFSQRSHLRREDTNSRGWYSIQTLSSWTSRHLFTIITSCHLYLSPLVPRLLQDHHHLLSRAHCRGLLGLLLRAVSPHRGPHQAHRRRVQQSRDKQTQTILISGCAFRRKN